MPAFPSGYVVQKSPSGVEDQNGELLALLVLSSLPDSGSIPDAY
jgi:hypothetical protein